jgi:flagellar basal-body rod modification protein FlgD
MNVNGTGKPQAPFDPKQQPSAPQDFAGKTALGKEDFLKLLVTQLSQQDPLNPTDSTQFVTQLSQFSSLEQLVNIREGMDMLAIVETAGSSAQMVSFIGKTVKVSDQVIVWEQGQTTAPIDFTLDGDAKDVKVFVKDANGKTVKTIDAGSLNAGSQQVAFDGKDEQGNAVEPGSYTFEVSAKDESGAEVGVSSTSNGVVTGVTFENGYPELVLSDGRKVQLGSVIEVMGDGQAAETSPETIPLSNLPKAAIDGVDSLIPDDFRI